MRFQAQLSGYSCATSPRIKAGKNLQFIKQSKCINKRSVINSLVYLFITYLCTYLLFTNLHVSPLSVRHDRQTSHACVSQIIIKITDKQCANAVGLFNKLQRHTAATLYTGIHYTENLREHYSELSIAYHFFASV